MTRVIRKSKLRASTDAAKLLAAVFSAELLAPSRTLWLVSPWISDVGVIDNRAASFGPLDAWGPRSVRLSEVLVALAGRGTFVVVATTPAPTNEPFRHALGRLFEERRIGDQLKVHVDDTGALHAKAITGDDFAIEGSMNITYHGITVREEFLQLRTDEAYVAQARMDAYDRFGGVL